jgi:nitrile hydratase
MTEEHDHSGNPPQPDEDRLAATEFEILERALRELLIEKGVFTADDIRIAVEAMDRKDPANGSKVVAHAWVDDAYRARLLDDSKAAIEELGIDVGPAPNLVVLENTATLQHVVVCTLCSCYPRTLLGMPPSWYKSREYRGRVVVEPRAVLREFGTELADDVEIKVVDSTADMRYLVLPARPDGTDGLSEAELADLVTRDSLIGVTQPNAPSGG